MAPSPVAALPPGAGEGWWLRVVWVRDTAWGLRARPMMDQRPGLAMIRVGVRFNLGAEDRWQCHLAQGKGTTVGALKGWHVRVGLGIPLGILLGSLG